MYSPPGPSGPPYEIDRELLADATRASAESVRTLAPAVDSSDLLRGKKAVTIQHNGAAYRLQATKLGKLILTK